MVTTLESVLVPLAGNKAGVSVDNPLAGRTIGLKEPLCGSPSIRFYTDNFNVNEFVELLSASTTFLKFVVGEIGKTVYFLDVDLIPKSVCSEACHPGCRKVVRQGESVCCFDCIPCSDGEVSNGSGICIKCPEDYWSNTEKDLCIAKYIEFLSYEDPLGTSLAAIAVVFSLMPVGVLCIFIKHHDTPVVKANNREVSYFLLISNLLCLLTALIFIGPPKDETCIFRQPAFGIFFSICVSAILAKTVTVVIAFNATKPGSRLKNLVGSKTSFFIIFCCLLLQFILCIIWLSVSPPFSETDKKLPEKTVIQCNEGSVLMFYCMLGYLGILATVSLLIAFLARNLPDSFNETKFITFSMIVFVTVWLTFIPAYVSTKGKYMVAAEIFAILSSSIGLLLCIFSPKCYIIIMRPEMNTRGYIVRQ
ncbi:vomeronasal type-2 receptor 26-like [Protopterus annectens]|uniref:vomeronasal type-2 receptor 26-like n=1 Tax=Protopterus annectens TaxID=7888 RepID=UPI001CF9A62A|nr:vomeronasal type-2 receptor 26-like [Protopterus annectens]